MSATAAKKVFIRTFGCQMNDYDSAKMADVLHAAEGYEPTQDVEQADLILFNTCSIREKAQEKVFSDLGRIKHLKDKGVLIGALIRSMPTLDSVDDLLTWTDQAGFRFEQVGDRQLEFVV